MLSRPFILSKSKSGPVCYLMRQHAFVRLDVATTRHASKVPGQGSRLEARGWSNSALTPLMHHGLGMGAQRRRTPPPYPPASPWRLISHPRILPPIVHNANAGDCTFAPHPTSPTHPTPWHPTCSSALTTSPTTHRHGAPPSCSPASCCCACPFACCPCCCLPSGLPPPLPLPAPAPDPSPDRRAWEEVAAAVASSELWAEPPDQACRRMQQHRYDVQRFAVQVINQSMPSTRHAQFARLSVDRYSTTRSTFTTHMHVRYRTPLLSSLRSSRPALTTVPPTLATSVPESTHKPPRTSTSCLPLLQFGSSPRPLSYPP